MKSHRKASCSFHLFSMSKTTEVRQASGHSKTEEHAQTYFLSHFACILWLHLSLTHPLSLSISLSPSFSNSLSGKPNIILPHFIGDNFSKRTWVYVKYNFLTHLNLYFCLTQFYAQTKNKQFSKFIITGGTPENRVTYALVGDKDSYSPNCQTNLFLVYLWSICIILQFNLHISLPLGPIWASYSVTKWLKYLFNIWPFRTIKISPNCRFFAKVDLRFAQYKINAQTIWQRLWFFCQNDEISPNLVALPSYASTKEL